MKKLMMKTWKMMNETAGFYQYLKSWISLANLNKKGTLSAFFLYSKSFFVNNTYEVINMKKKIFLLVIILIVGLAAIYFGNNINRSLKKIPESAILL
jgi:hypothetical protein